MRNKGFELAVIGGGHAGVEASLAAARLGVRTVMFTISLDNIANMPCNPSVGGTAKGHLVREIDALGGEMGKAADACTLQSRMLGRGKGAAVHSLRVQADRVKYHNYMKKVVEAQENLQVIQAEITEIVTVNGALTAVKSRYGMEYEVKAAIIATGTYLAGKVHVGETSYSSGPDSTLPALLLSDSLRENGISLRRFKTGTPCRVHRRSVDFDKLEIQYGDSEITPFSFTNTLGIRNILPCYIAYTNAKTHEIIRENIHRSPLYAGVIKGTGPRYCPSIEDKITRFADKERHQIFVEPMGLDTDEFYLQGMSSSLPFDVQEQFIKSISGMENAEIMRPAYAIEYDCCDPTELNPTLEFKKIKGLYGAGQFNGSSGYEEAAAQGLVAGISAAFSINGGVKADMPPASRVESDRALLAIRDVERAFILPRSSSYIGTLIDDLTTKGCADPYRVMTSRSEYRLILRQDNADRRLTPIGYKIGLISQERHENFQEKTRLIDAEIKRLEKLTVAPCESINGYLRQKGTAELVTGVKLSDLIRRPELDYEIVEISGNGVDLGEKKAEITEAVTLDFKYRGYVEKQLLRLEQQKKLETRVIPSDFDYSKVKGLRLEATEKLAKHRPYNVAAAAQISGVSPADITVLLVALRYTAT